MVTIILLALSTSVISISDDTFTACSTITTDATFISAILASATTCYRKEGEVAGEEGERRGRGRAVEVGEGRGSRGRGGEGVGQEGGGKWAGEEGGGEGQ